MASSSLDRSALSGVLWSSGAKWTTQLLSWGSTILVARILVPSDYGVMSMAAVFLGVVSMLSEFGIGAAVLTFRELSRDELRQLHGFSLLLGLGGSVLAALAAYPLGLFFRAPHLPPVLAVVGLTFAINALQTVPAALLRRQLKFRVLALIDLTRGILMPLATLAGAMAGLGYWALALGSLTGALISAVMVLVVQPQGIAWPVLSRLGHVMRMSRDVLVSRLAWIVYQDGDFAVAGRQLGEAAAGVYSLAWTLASNPIDKITAILSDVTPSLFSAVQDDRPALRRYFLKLTEVLCLATFPAAVGIAMVGHDLVSVLLGPKWDGVAGPLAMLALYAGGRSVTQVFGFLFNATRETNFAMWTSIVTAVLLLTGFVVGSQWGGVGIAAAWLIIHPLTSAYSFTRVQRVLDLSVREYFATLRPGLDGTVIMAAVLAAFQWLVAPAWPAVPRLVASIALGAATFLLATLLLHGRRLREILAWFRRARQAEPPSA